MKKLVIACLFCLMPAAVWAGMEPVELTGNSASHAGTMPKDYREQPAGPPPGQTIQKYAVDAPGRPQQNFGIQPVHDNMIFYTFRADRLEYRATDGDDVLLWDVEAWLGGDYNKLYLESEGEKVVDDDVEEASLELLYSRNVHSFWDLQAGVRHDFKPEPTRSFLALGVQGLAPQWFEVDAAVYLSDDGDISALAEVEYDLLLTQRLVLQPRLETGLAVQDVEELNIGSGITRIELGLRLRYEISRKFAPYVGFSWSRLIGETKDLVRADGGDTDKTFFVAGVKLWF